MYLSTQKFDTKIQKLPPLYHKKTICQVLFLLTANIL